MFYLMHRHNICVNSSMHDDDVLIPTRISVAVKLQLDHEGKERTTTKQTEKVEK